MRYANQQCTFFVQDVDAFLVHLPVGDLPGVGWSLQQRLGDLGIDSVAQLRVFPRETLQEAVGATTAGTIISNAWGTDDRKVRSPLCLD